MKERLINPGDLVKMSTGMFDPDPVGLVLSVETRTFPNSYAKEGGKTITYRYPLVLWPEHVVGKSGYTGRLRMIQEHFSNEIMHVDEKRGTKK